MNIDQSASYVLGKYQCICLYKLCKLIESFFQILKSFLNYRLKNKNIEKDSEVSILIKILQLFEIIMALGIYACSYGGEAYVEIINSSSSLCSVNLMSLHLCILLGKFPSCLVGCLPSCYEGC